MLPGSTDVRPLVGGLLLLALSGARLAAQAGGGCAAPAIAAVVPQPGYRAGGLHRLLLGGHYRDLWTDTVRVPVLALACIGDGAHVVRQGGGQQTKSLRLEDASGRLYAFRSLDKDPSKTLPEELRGTIADRVLQDQISAALPAAPLIAARLADAAGIPNLAPRLFVLADDPALGEFRQAFGGLLGFLEVGAAEAAGADDDARAPISTPTLFARLEKHADEGVDVPAFVAARLFDVYIGDWDRHQDQWRWAARSTPAGRRWAPIPRDRDQAFSRYDGVLLGMARATQPKFLKFGDRYGSVMGATWNGRDLDRRLLGAAPWPLWDSVATALATRLTDAVIDDAVSRMVPANARETSRLAAGLRSRRDLLPAEARRFYRQLASAVDIHASDALDSVTLAWQADGGLDVTVDADGRTTFHRRFDPAETQEVRLFLYDGKDRVRLVGGGPAHITARLVGGARGERVVDAMDAGAGGTRLVVYDREAADSLPPSRHVATSGDPFVAPAGWDSTKPPPRDWGGWTVPSSQVSYGPDIGLFVGGGRTHFWYGFRRYPYRASLTVKAGFATGVMRPRLEVIAELPEWGAGGLRPVIRGLASGTERVRFFGFGNTTTVTQPSSYYRAPAEAYRLDLGLRQGFGRHTRATAGVAVIHTTSDLDDPTRILSVLRPYGAGGFTMIGSTLLLEIDSRDVRGAPTQGVHLRAGGAYYPSAADVQSQFGDVHGDVATYLTPGRGGPTLALHAGGRKVWGTYPYLEAAYAGGATTIRGFREQRFAGDAAAWGGAELRQHVGTVTLVLPARVGLLALGDAGRVWYRGESSSTWHTGVGGGLSLGYLNGTSTLTIAVAHSSERNAVYVRGGHAF